MKFKSAIHAEECINLMHGRFFDERELKCSHWDGKTDYAKVSESQDRI